MKSVNSGEMLQECLLGFLWRQDKGFVKMNLINTVLALALCYFCDKPVHLHFLDAVELRGYYLVKS